MRGGTSVEYRCHLLDTYGQIVWRHRFLAPSDDDAIASARMFLQDRADSTSFFELWQDRRFIACEIDGLIRELATANTAKLLLSDAPQPEVGRTS